MPALDRTQSVAAVLAMPVTRIERARRMTRAHSVVVTSGLGWLSVTMVTEVHAAEPRARDAEPDCTAGIARGLGIILMARLLTILAFLFRCARAGQAHVAHAALLAARAATIATLTDSDGIALSTSCRSTASFPHVQAARVHPRMCVRACWPKAGVAHAPRSQLRARSRIKLMRRSERFRNLCVSRVRWRLRDQGVGPARCAVCVSLSVSR